MTGSVGVVSHAQSPSFGNLSIYNYTLPENFNPATDIVTWDGATVVFTHYYTVEEIIHILYPVWAILFLISSFISYRYIAPIIITKLRNRHEN